MEEASRVHGSGPNPPIIPAMKNLNVAIRPHMKRGPLCHGEINAIAAVPDGAAGSRRATQLRLGNHIAAATRESLIRERTSLAAQRLGLCHYDCAPVCPGVIAAMGRGPCRLSRVS